jgi:hypothetical protein
LQGLQLVIKQCKNRGNKNKGSNKSNLIKTSQKFLENQEGNNNKISFKKVLVMQKL